MSKHPDYPLKYEEAIEVASVINACALEPVKTPSRVFEHALRRIEEIRAKYKKARIVAHPSWLETYETQFRLWADEQRRE